MQRHPRRPLASLVALAALLAACSGSPSDAGGSTGASALAERDCDHATARLDTLYVASLEADPVLAARPELAREHARQTRDAVVKPIAAQCTGAAFRRCVDDAPTFAEAAHCP